MINKKLPLYLLTLLVLSSFVFSFSIIGEPVVKMITEKNYLINVSYVGNFTMFLYTNTVNDFSTIGSPASKYCEEGGNNCMLILSNMDLNKTIYYKLIFSDGITEFNKSGSFTTLYLYDFNVTDISAHNASIKFQSNKAVSPRLVIFKGSTVIKNETLPASTNHAFFASNLTRGSAYTYYIIIDDVLFSDPIKFKFSTASIDYIRSLDITVPPYTLSDIYVNSNYFVIAGITDTRSRVTLRNYGTSVDFYNQTDETGSFYFNISLKCRGNGKNFIQVIAKNQENAEGVKNVTVICDVEPPSLDIDVSSAKVSDSIVNFSVGVSENMSVHIWHNRTVNGSTVSTFDDGVYSVVLNGSYGSFIIQIDLSVSGVVGVENPITAKAAAGMSSDDGEYFVFFEAIDALSNKRTYIKEVTVDETPPFIRIDKIETPVFTSFVKITGKTEPNTKVKIVNLGNLTQPPIYNREDERYYTCLKRDGRVIMGTCDERAISEADLRSNWIGEIYDLVDNPEVESDENGNFEKTVALTEGQNMFAFSSKDSSGNVVSTSENYDSCSINGRSGCTAVIEMKGTNDDLYVIESRPFPEMISYDILSSDDVTRRTGTIFVLIGSRQYDIKNIVVTGADASLHTTDKFTKELVKENMNAQYFFDGNNLVVPIKYEFKRWDKDPREFRTTLSEIAGVGGDAKTLEFDAMLHITYDITGEGGEERADPDPLPIHVSLNVQTPDFTDFLTEERVNRWIGYIEAIRNVTTVVEDVSLEIAKWDMIACAAKTAWIYVKAATSEGATTASMQEDYKQLYYLCDRIACPFVPPKCFDETKGFDTLNPNKYLGINDKSVELYFYTNEEWKKLDATNPHKAACVAACGAFSSASCVVRKNIVSQQDSSWVSADTTGIYAKPTSYKTNEEFQKNIGDMNIGLSCYGAPNVDAGQYYDISCLENRIRGLTTQDFSNPWITGKNPGDDIITSARCGCVSGFYQHMHNINTLLQNVQECLVGINSGEFKAGYCQELVSQYVCDWIYSQIKRFKEEGFSPLGGDPNKGETSGYPQKQMAEVNNNLQKRYDDTVMDPETGFNRKGLAHAACMAAFGADWSLFENAITDMVKEKEVEPIIGPPHGYSRLLSPDYLKGELSVYYNVKLGIISGGQDIDYKVIFYCDKSKPNGEYCMPAFSGNEKNAESVAIVEIRDMVRKGESEGDTVEKVLTNSRGWANMVMLKAEYMLDGEKRTKVFTKEIAHYGELPLGCTANLDIATIDAASKVFTCTMIGDSPIGGTIRLKSAKASAQNTFYPGDEVNVKFSLSNNMYGAETYILKYKVSASGFTTVEGDQVVNTKSSLPTMENDINMHLFSLKSNEQINERTILYNPTSWSSMVAENRQQSVIENNLNSLKGITAFYVKSSNGIKINSLTFSSPLESAFSSGTQDEDRLKYYIFENGVIGDEVNKGYFDLLNSFLDYPELEKYFNPDKTISVPVKRVTTECEFDSVVLTLDDEIGYTYPQGAANCKAATKTFLFGLSTNKFSCDKYNNQDDTYVCTKFLNAEVQEISLKVSSVSGEVVVEVYKNIDSNNKAFSFIYNLGAATSLPTNYPKGTYTMYVTMYRDAGSIGFNQGEDTLLPYGPRDQSEEIKFTIDDKGTNNVPVMDIIFPPQDHPVSCDGGSIVGGGDGGGLLIGLNINNMPEKVFYQITIGGSKIYKGEFSKSDMSNYDSIGSGGNTIGFGNYIIVIEDALRNVQTRSLSGSTSIQIKLCKDADCKETYGSSKMVNVAKTDRTSPEQPIAADCSLGYAKQNPDVNTNGIVLIKPTLSETKTTGTTTEIEDKTCIGESTHTVKPTSGVWFNICSLSGYSGSDACASTNCFVEVCETNGIKLNSLYCARIKDNGYIWSQEKTCCVKS